MAQVQISQLPAAGAITGTELVPVVQNGVTVQTTTGAISSSPNQTQTFLTKNQELTLPNSRYLSADTGLGLTDGGALSFYRISLTGAAGSLETASGGIIAKNSASTVVARSMAVSGAGLSVSNADGTGGNPTFQLSGLAAALANIGGTGLVAVQNGTTAGGVQILGTANQIAVANGNGSGNPTISIASNPIFPGTGSATLPVGTNSQRPVGAIGEIRYNTDTQTFEGYAAGSWRDFSLSGGVASFSAGVTGLTPSIPTAGVVTLGGTLNVGHGGTGTTTLTGYIKGNGTSAMTASPTIPNTDVSGLGTMSTQNANNVAITGGTINGTAIGGTTPSSAIFTTVAATSGTVSTTPANSTDIANKAYVDSVAQGLNVHAACDAATTGTLASITGGSVTYNNGSSGVGATLTLSVALTTLDGYTLINGDRILVKNEANTAHNGIYTWATGGLVLTRATDFDTTIEIVDGDFTFVTYGTTYANTGWVQTLPVTTIGTSPIVWAQFSGAGTYTAGTGLSLAGNVFSIANTGVTATTYGSASQVPVLAVNAQGQLTLVTNTSIAINAAAVSGLAPSATTDTTNASNITSGTLPTGRLSGSYTGITGVGTLTAGTWNGSAIGVSYGGTGVTAAPSNGQLLIGNGLGYTLSTLTAGTNVSISNTAGGITISATPAAGGTVQSVDVSGGTTGLTFSGGPVTVTGTITMAGTLGVANGGTGATTLTGYVKGSGTSAFTASTTIPNTDITGLGSMSTQNANNVAITGGAIDGTPIGATTASSGKFTTVIATSGISGGTF